MPLGLLDNLVIAIVAGTGCAMHIVQAVRCPPIRLLKLLKASVLFAWCSLQLHYALTGLHLDNGLFELVTAVMVAIMSLEGWLSVRRPKVDC